jgi:hypothetical protein
MIRGVKHSNSYCNYIWQYDSLFIIGYKYVWKLNARDSRELDHVTAINEFLNTKIDLASKYIRPFFVDGSMSICVNQF